MIAPKKSSQTTTRVRKSKPPVMMRSKISTFSFLVAALISSSGCILINSISPSLAANAVLLDQDETNVRTLPSDPRLDSNSGPQTTALNYLLFSGNNAATTTTNSRLNLLKQQQEYKLNDNNNNAKLIGLLKDSNHSHVSDAIDLQLANNVWRQMRQNAADFAQQRANQAKPSINRLLDQARISSACRKSLNDIIDHIANLDQWAVQMYNAFGDFPASGFFEGSLTSMGSYHQCVNLEPNEIIGEPKYCTYKFQPIVPKRPKFHNILAPVEGLANFTSKDDVSPFYLFSKNCSQLNT